jgi:inosine/xanthosine triphosphate pyrophosphatase family protein
MTTQAFKLAEFANKLDSAIKIDKVSYITNNTGSVITPVGTVAQRDASPAVGYLRYNSDYNSFEGYTAGGWGPIGSGAKGFGSNAVFFENDSVVTADYTISAGKNAVSAGPITINSGVTVTIPSDSNWVIV